MFYVADLNGELVTIHNTPVLAVAVTDNINEVVVALEQLPESIPPLDPTTSLATKIY